VPEPTGKNGEDKAEHMRALRDADETLEKIQKDVAVGRARLQRAIARYEERASDPRRT
jgi:hypothetical protein